jgi:uncharacterized protein (PEP-CTERM system associated)
MSARTMAITGMTRAADGPVPRRPALAPRVGGHGAASAPRILSTAVLALLASSASAQYGVPNAVPPAATGNGQPGAAQTPGEGPRRTTIFTPTIGIEETLTSNANFDRGISEPKADLVTTISPGFLLNYRSARANFAGSVALPILIYARTGQDNNRMLPQVNLGGVLEAWERFFYIDGAAYVSQQYFTPFGARPVSPVNGTSNEYMSQSYRVSPYIKGELRGGIRYELRNNNIWTLLSQGSEATPGINNSYTNQIIGTMDSDPRPLGWGADYLRSSVAFSGQDTFVTELARLRGVYRVDPQVELTVSGGYESNDYAFVDYKGAIYGVGVRWRPTERTNLDARWEHRFFGSSYNVDFGHRTALTVWNVRVSRDATSYPEQVASLAAGTSVVALIDSLFALRVTDPALRQQLVEQFIRDRGLPTFVNSALNLYTQQINLVTSAQASVGLIGVRNTLVFNAYHHKNEAITAAGDITAGPASGLTNNTQSGGSIIWTHNLSPLMIMTSTLDYSHTKALPPQTVRTDQGALTVVVSRPISPLTSVHAGARYQSLRSDIRTDYEEAAIFVGFDHRFN